MTQYNCLPSTWQVGSGQVRSGQESSDLQDLLLTLVLQSYISSDWSGQQDQAHRLISFCEQNPHRDHRVDPGAGPPPITD